MVSSTSSEWDVRDLPLYIDGHFDRAASGEDFALVDPATGRDFGRAAQAGPDDVDRAVAAARTALDGPWGRMPAPGRQALLHAIAAGIEAHAERFVEAEVRDTGRPLTMARGFDVPRAAATFREFASLSAGLAGESFTTQAPDGTRAISYALRVPLGVVGLICPWNLPLVLLTWKLAPALAMGNTVVVKPSEHSPSTATLLAEIMAEAGVPPGVFNVVHGYGPGGAGEAIVRHPGVAAISFTGETATGRAIMADAAPGLKKLSLELGGKNAAVIFADADLGQAVPACARSVFLHAGQLCLCNERIFVERPIYAQVVERLAAAASGLVVGDPRAPRTRMGPLTNAEQRDKVRSYYDRARNDGATILAGGGVPSLPAPFAGGFFVQPTVWADLPASSSLWTEEVFGPCCAVAPFDTEDEVVARVNETDYGLAASLWTGDGGRATRMAARLDVGVVWINCWLVRDLRTPFGGSKHSGIGREGGVHSFAAFSQLRNVTVAS
ncbi:MAG: 2-hydroxymuconic semialdehyde dehydrogenase [Nannocystaceae bacterium]